MATTTLKTLESRLRTILPEDYHEREDVQPVSMGSAGLKYGPDGRVAWNQMWASFCDLAMAGGPPHKGTLLEPGSAEEIAADPAHYGQVVEEICRGIALVFNLPAEPAPDAGWVRVNCPSWAMAEWLVRAIAMENVSVRTCEGGTLDLPAGPAYRVEKEIKNVITAMAKTCHYWADHMPASQQRGIASLFLRIEQRSPLLQPDVVGDDGLRAGMVEAIQQGSGLRAAKHTCAGWLGVLCPDVPSAIWMMRMVVASNILCRREETTIFLPVNPVTDPGGERVVRTVVQIHRYARAQSIL